MPAASCLVFYLSRRVDDSVTWAALSVWAVTVDSGLYPWAVTWTSLLYARQLEEFIDLHPWLPPKKNYVSMANTAS